ncbi:unnamed protein product [Bemisia tabaci]|uniref:Anaphase-promoting complex subunit 4-like WD40 domain-containing protein n=1 Tax=Bemisia tabaci TaxID=7038 RepID=A0A9P0AMA7_BEMTA|nr:unnamed protein product [Bemisia tabaci]
MDVIKRFDAKLCRFSLCNRYFAYSGSDTLFVEDISTGKSRQYKCHHTIEDIAWSPDSEFICCGQYKNGTVQIFSLCAPLWRFNLESGQDSIADGIWSPDSRHFLTTAQFMEYITIWSLVNKTACYIQLLKPIAHPAIKFSPDGKYLALLEAEGTEDFLSVFHSSSWEKLCTFKCSKYINSSGGLAWCPDSEKICVWDSQLNCCRILVCKVSSQSVIASYAEPTINKPAGIHSASWSPSGQLLLLASYDNKIRVLNNITWTSISEFDCGQRVTGRDNFIYTQVISKPSPMVSSNSTHIKASFKIVEDRPVSIKSGMKKFGYDLKWCHNGKYLAVFNFRFDHAVRIWNMENLSLHSMILLDFPISDFKWSPVYHRLVLCFEKPVITVWTEDNVQSVSIPFLSKKGNLKLKTVEWQPRSGSYFALCSDAETVLVNSAIF